MAVLDDIITERLDRLDSIPDAFTGAVAKNEIKLFTEIRALYETLQRENGIIIANQRNILIAQQIKDNLTELVFLSGYEDSLITFLGEFQQQALVNQAFFTELTQEVFDDKALYSAVIRTAEERANLLMGESYIESNYSTLLSDIIDQSIGENFVDSVQGLSDAIIGTPELDGKLLRYVKGISRDRYTASDSTYTEIVSEDLDFVFYEYSGSLVKDSRDFCIARVGKVYHVEEVRLWVTRSGSLEANPSPRGEWQGKNNLTNETNIFVLRGGFSCLHALIPVHTSTVSKSVLERARASGYIK